MVAAGDLDRSKKATLHVCMAYVTCTDTHTEHVPFDYAAIDSGLGVCIQLYRVSVVETSGMAL